MGLAPGQLLTKHDEYLSREGACPNFFTASELRLRWVPKLELRNQDNRESDKPKKTTQRKSVASCRFGDFFGLGVSFAADRKSRRWSVRQ